jgi:hypothetical protein
MGTALVAVSGASLAFVLLSSINPDAIGGRTLESLIKRQPEVIQAE